MDIEGGVGGEGTGGGGASVVGVDPGAGAGVGIGAEGVGEVAEGVGFPGIEEEVGEAEAMEEGFIGFAAGLGGEDGGFEGAAVIGHDFQDPFEGLESAALLFDLGLVKGLFIRHGGSSLNY